MIPHVIGWFPYTSAWVIMFHALRLAQDDLAEVSTEKIPEWVFGAIIGTFLIFCAFAVVQMLYQWYAPGYYCKPWPLKPIALQRELSSLLRGQGGTEILYCSLSLTAKLYLGW